MRDGGRVKVASRSAIVVDREARDLGSKATAAEVAVVGQGMPSPSSNAAESGDKDGTNTTERDYSHSEGAGGGGRLGQSDTPAGRWADSSRKWGVVKIMGWRKETGMHQEAIARLSRMFSITLLPETPQQLFWQESRCQKNGTFSLYFETI